MAHKVAAVLRPLLLGERIVCSRLRGQVGDPLAGLRVVGIEALGKHLFLRLGSGLVVRSHLGMYGSWHRYAPQEPWRKPGIQAALVLQTDTVVLVRFNAREVELLSERGIRERSLRQRLGPDLTAPGLDPGEVVARARARLPAETPLVDLSLDQTVAAGIGNVYKSEVLFLRGQPPLRRLRDLGDDTLAGLFDCAGDLLRRNLGRARRTTRFVAGISSALWVYGRKGRPCLQCATPLEYGRLGRHLRPTYWCPLCQRVAAGGIG